MTNSPSIPGKSSVIRPTPNSQELNCRKTIEVLGRRAITMKSGFLVSWIVALFFLLFLSSAPQPAAASGEDLQVSHSFDKTDYIPSETGNITLTIKNTSDAQVVIESVMVRTDWQATDEFFENNTLMGQALNTTGDTCQVQVAFNISRYAKVVDHSWNISIVYDNEGSNSTFTWTSENFTDFKVSGFEVIVSPESITIFPGEKAVFTITVLGMNGFSKEIQLWSDCWPLQDTDRPWINYCTPEPVWGTNTSTVRIKTESSTKPGKYTVDVSAYCPNGTTKLQHGLEQPGVQTDGYGKLIVNQRPKGLVDLPTNCVALGGIVAILAIAVVTAGLFAVEKRRESRKT